MEEEEERGGIREDLGRGHLGVLFSEMERAKVYPSGATAEGARTGSLRLL